VLLFHSSGSCPLTESHKLNVGFLRLAKCLFALESEHPRFTTMFLFPSHYPFLPWPLPCPPPLPPPAPPFEQPPLLIFRRPPPGCPLPFPEPSLAPYAIVLLLFFLVSFFFFRTIAISFQGHNPTQLRQAAAFLSDSFYIELHDGR